MSKKKITAIHVSCCLLLLLIIFLLLPKSQEYDKEFKKLCKENGYEWMVMQPMNDGKIKSRETCHGCMVGTNHICNKEEFLKIIENES